MDANNTSVPGGEFPGALAARYNEMVTAFFECIHGPSEGGHPYWNLLASAQDNPRMTTFDTAGGPVQFDLFFHHRPSGENEPHRFLVVETKASSDRPYVQREFPRFLRRSLAVRERLGNTPGESYDFVYVAPVAPDGREELAPYHDSGALSLAFRELCQMELTPEQNDLIRGRIAVLVLADETASLLGVT